MTRVRTREWSGTDYYAVLGVPSAATPTAIDATYRRLAKALHPDRNADPDDEERFKQISVAYATLRDPSARLAYDGFRATANATANPGGVSHRQGERPVPERATSHLAPARVPKPHRPVPQWLRRTTSIVLALLGLTAAFWAGFGDLPAPTAADTPLAVQITLMIVAVKLLLCGAAVAWYPQLRARWHR